MQAGRPIPATVFVKLVFLLGHETDLGRDRSFHDFLPCRYGPFSFTLHRELGTLRQNGYVTTGDDIALCERTRALAGKEVEGLDPSIRSSVADILARCGHAKRRRSSEKSTAGIPGLLSTGELPERNFVSVLRPGRARPAVCTIGYEGRSVDTFFNDLLKRGIEVVVDVGANPVSRKYGFSGLRLAGIRKKLGIEYRQVRTPGIPGTARTGLDGFAAYQRLLARYVEEILPRRTTDLKALGRLVQRKPSVLVCVEKDVRCCHRSRLAEVLARETGMDATRM